MKVLENNRKEEELKRKVLTAERENDIQSSQAQIEYHKKFDLLINFFKFCYFCYEEKE